MSCKKRCAKQVPVLSNSESDSDDDVPLSETAKKRRRSASKPVVSDESDGGETETYVNENEPETPPRQVSPEVMSGRSSARIREKISKHGTLKLPSRQKVLSDITPAKTPQKSHSHLQPRKMKFDFTRVTHTYNTDKGLLSDSDPDLDNFVVSDGEVEEDGESSSKSEGGAQTTSQRRLTVRRRLLNEDSSDSNDNNAGNSNSSSDEESIQPIRRRRTTSVAARVPSDSSEEEKPTGRVTRSSQRQRVHSHTSGIHSSSSDSDRERSCDSKTSRRNSLKKRGKHDSSGSEDRKYGSKITKRKRPSMCRIDSDSSDSGITTLKTSHSPQNDIPDVSNENDPDKKMSESHDGLRFDGSEREGTFAKGAVNTVKVEPGVSAQVGVSAEQEAHCPEHVLYDILHEDMPVLIVERSDINPAEDVSVQRQGHEEDSVKHESDHDIDSSTSSLPQSSVNCTRLDDPLVSTTAMMPESGLRTDHTQIHRPTNIQPESEGSSGQTRPIVTTAHMVPESDLKSSESHQKDQSITAHSVESGGTICAIPGSTMNSSQTDQTVETPSAALGGSVSTPHSVPSITAPLVEPGVSMFTSHTSETGEAKDSTPSESVSASNNVQPAASNAQPGRPATEPRMSYPSQNGRQQVQEEQNALNAAFSPIEIKPLSPQKNDKKDGHFLVKSEPTAVSGTENRDSETVHRGEDITTPAKRRKKSVIETVTVSSDSEANDEDEESSSDSSARSSEDGSETSESSELEDRHEVLAKKKQPWKQKLEELRILREKRGLKKK